MQAIESPARSPARAHACSSLRRDQRRDDLYIYHSISTSLDTHTHNNNNNPSSVSNIQLSISRSIYDGDQTQRRRHRSVCLPVARLLRRARTGQPVLADGGGGKKHDDVADTVKKEVAKAMDKNDRVGAALVRLLFHDCWVHGCDGSVLLDKTPDGGSKTEKDATNNIGLEGFDLIDRIKGKLGESVSCADIVVLAARDATFILSRGNIVYNVTTGRKDGVRSSAAAADAVLPPSTFNFTQLKANFAARNFTQMELVVLSGAHAVGVAHLSSFRDRLDNATATPISARYQEALTDHVEEQKSVQETLDPTEPNNIRDMGLSFRNASGYNATGVDTSKAARGVLDNSYYHANLQNKVLFRSDWELRNDTTGAAGRDMREFRDNAAGWYVLFGKAMAKLSELPAEGSRFEIRTDCRTIN